MKKYLAIIVAVILIVAAVFVYKARELKSLKVCTEMPAKRNGASFSPEAAAKNLWESIPSEPLVLYVKFLNGTDWQKGKVKFYSKEWTAYSEHDLNKRAKIQFRFMDESSTEDGDIRIWFEPGGSESAIGTAARDSPNEPTMRLGWVEKSEKEDDVRQVILHEFGHALGLVHEHQRQEATIVWDTAAVYKYYKETQDPPWDTAKVNHNIFNRYDQSTINGLAYDKNSIMHYAVPAKLTQKNCCPVSFNSRLSAEDIDVIRRLYTISGCGLRDECRYDKQGIIITNK